MPGVIAEATEFIVACHAGKKTENMSVLHEAWSRNMGKATVTRAPEQKTLSSTTGAFEHARPAHTQTAIWKSAIDSSSRSLGAAQSRWTRDEATKLTTVTLPFHVTLAPSESLKLNKCVCS